MCEQVIEEYKMDSGNLYTHIKGNALDWAEKDGYCMIHVCNAQGVMGSGIAKQVKERFPNAYSSYLGEYILGTATSDASEDYKMNVINLVAQEYYGHYGKRYLNYGALACSLSLMMNKYYSLLLNSGVQTIVIPFKMGAFRAGGDWDIVIEMCRFMIGGIFNILVVEY